MRITVVVDANVIMSALLGGRPSTILFDHRFQWSQDKDFEKANYPKLLKTYHFIGE